MLVTLFNAAEGMDEIVALMDAIVVDYVRCTLVSKLRWREGRGSEGRTNCHVVLCQGTSLVGANHRGAPKCFDDC